MVKLLLFSFDYSFKIDFDGLYSLLEFIDIPLILYFEMKHFSRLLHYHAFNL